MSQIQRDAVTLDAPPTEIMAVESKDKLSPKDVKLYGVSVVADVQMSLKGTVNVYAVDDDEAIAKVQAQMEDETLDGELEMEDLDSRHADEQH